ncbi:MAG: hypothetical protein QM538_06370 [Methylacidiphilales bacterium]|nr:hypothetical protein [Candidatus Methylacidiphilales bacterium]
MTIEVVTSNKFGIAIASECQFITKGNSKTQTPVHIIRDSANKIFQIHNSIPIGIFYTGSSAICGIAIEQIIKGYRNSKYPDSLTDITLEDYVEGYAKSFVIYLNELIRDENKIIDNDNVLNYLKKEINYIENIENQKSETTSTDCYESKDQESNITYEFIKLNYSKSKEELKEELKKRLVGIDTKDLYKKIEEVSLERCRRAGRANDNVTIYFIGYGKNEISPTKVSVAIEEKKEFNMIVTRRTDSEYIKSLEVFGKDCPSVTLKEPVYNPDEIKQGILNRVYESGNAPDDYSTEQLAKNFFQYFDINLKLIMNPYIDEIKERIKNIENMSPMQLAIYTESLLVDLSTTIDEYCFPHTIDVVLITKYEGLSWVKKKFQFQIKDKHKFVNQYP